MGDEKKQDEPGLLAQAVAGVQHAELKTVEVLGGKEAADLAAKAFQAGNEGKHLERARLGFQAEAKMAGHAIDAVKKAGAEIDHFTHEHLAGVTLGGGVLGLPGALVGARIQDKISGGEHVSEPASVSTSLGKRRDPSRQK